MTNQATVLEGPEQTRGAQLIAQRAALRLELIGLRRRGRSMFSIIKEAHGFKGSKQKVYEQFNAFVREKTGV